jgi:hypothetical protein
MALYHRVTLGDLITKLTERLGENTTFWTSQEKTDAINEAIAFWQAMTGQWTATFIVGPNLEQSTFMAVPRQVVSNQRISINGTPLSSASLAEMDDGFPGWQATTGTTAYWTPAGMNYVAFSPAPAASDAILFQGISASPRLAASGDFIDIGDEELTRLLGYAQAYLTFKEGPTESSATDPSVQTMMEAATFKNSRLKGSALYRKFMGESRDVWQRPYQLPSSQGAR